MLHINNRKLGKLFFTKVDPPSYLVSIEKGICCVFSEKFYYKEDFLTEEDLSFHTIEPIERVKCCDYGKFYQMKSLR